MFVWQEKQIERIVFIQNTIMVVILEQPTYFSVEDIRKKVEGRIIFSVYGKYGNKKGKIDIDKMIQMAIYTLQKYNLVKYDSLQEEYLVNFPANAVPRK